MLPIFSSRATLFQISGESLQVLLGLAHQRRNPDQALDDVSVAFAGGRVMQDIGRVEAVADQFDIDGRVMPVALDLLDVEPRGLDGIAHDFDIGALLLVQRLGIELGDARFDVALQLDLCLDPRRAEIIQFVFEYFAVMLVVAHGAGGHRRERQAAKDEIIHDLAELQVGGRRTGRRNPAARHRNTQGET